MFLFCSTIKIETDEKMNYLKYKTTNLTYNVRFILKLNLNNF